MTRNLKVSLLIFSMLVVLGATSSQACCFFRRGCQGIQSYCQSGYGYGNQTGYYSSGQGRLRHDRRRLRWRRDGRLSRWVRVRPARLRLRPARLQPGRPRWAGVRDRGAARPGRRRLRAGALTVHRLSDQPAGAHRPVDLRAHSGRCQRRSTDERRGRLPRGRQVRRFETQPLRPGATPVATRPYSWVERTTVSGECRSPQSSSPIGSVKTNSRWLQSVTRDRHKNMGQFSRPRDAVCALASVLS